MPHQSDDKLNFYRKLPAMQGFAEVTNTREHADVPPDWWIVIADIAGSTKAIEAGAYKKVNTVGVACIAAVVNVDRNVDLPFVFGGDGATFAIPDAMRERAISALRGAQRLARESFELSLRVGLVRVGDLVDQGFWLRLGKVQTSPNMMQPVLSGRGWEEAERRVKAPDGVGVLKIEESNGVADANFEGFECRWQGVPSFNGHKLSLLITAISPDLETNLQTYRGVFEQIDTIYGEVARYHPLRSDRMQMSFNPRQLSHEWRVRTAHLWLGSRMAYFARMVFNNAAGRYLFARKRDTDAVQWGKYRDELVENSDFRKFDGTLRMVIDGNDEQSEKLTGYLESEFVAGRLAYGLHKSREALVTCIVQSYNGNHQHFVDGSDGGYALAARELKRHLARIPHSEPIRQE